MAKGVARLRDVVVTSAQAPASSPVHSSGAISGSDVHQAAVDQVSGMLG